MSNLSVKVENQIEVSPFLGEEGNKDKEQAAKDIQCGFGICRNSFSQRFATEAMYVAIYGLAGCVLSMILSYFTGTITTMEKLFKISSQTTGVIAVGNDISTMLGALITGYYLRQVHRPRWIGFSLFISVIYCLITSSLHFLYGPGEDALNLSKTNLTSSELNPNLCQTSEAECIKDDDIWMPELMLFTAQFIFGIGQAIFLVVGLAYMDDNIDKSKTPAMLSVATFIRMLGPAAGYSLASICLRWYIAPNTDPLIKPDDPRWLGAWWLGWLVLASITFVMGSLLVLFPKELPSSQARRLELERDGAEPAKQPSDLSINDMWQCTKRLAVNKVYMYNLWASIFYFFGYGVYWTFTPKYIETQYRQTASMAAMSTGSIAFAFSAAGVLLSGFVVSKYKPTGRAMSAWNAIVDFLTVAGCICYVFIGCADSDRLGSMGTTNGTCSATCHCDYVHYVPICSPDNITYISACHAGCTGQSKDEVGRTTFTGCSCISSANMTSILDKYAVDGACPVDCTKQFMVFLSVMCFLKLIGASSKSTNLLISLRSMDPEDKSFALGLGCMIASLTTFIPSPIFFGWLIDRSCMVWGKTCSRTGNCLLYDTESLRYVLNIVAAGFILVAGFLNIAVWRYATDLKIFKDDEKGKIMQSEKRNEDITLKRLSK